MKPHHPKCSSSPSSAVELRSILEQTWTNARNIPHDGWWITLFGCCLSILFAMFFWMTATGLGGLSVLAFQVVSAILLAGTYVATAGLIGKPTTFGGYIRFVLTGIATLLPAGFIIQLTALAHPPPHVFTSAAVVGFAITFILGGLLAAWPISQALSTKLVSPVRIWKATSGYRTPLITLGLVAGVMGKFRLMLPSPNDFEQAALIAVAQAVMVSAYFVLTAALGAAAWQFGVHRNQALDRPHRSKDVPPSGSTGG